MVAKKRRRGETRDDSKAEVIEDMSTTAKRPRTRAAARIEDESGSSTVLNPTGKQNTVQSDGMGRDMAALKRKISKLEAQLKAQGAKAQAKEDEFETLKRTFTSDLSAIEERLWCGICFNTLWYPYLLQECGHSFCEDCILSWLSEYQRNPRIPTCPQCRMAIRDMPTEIIFVKDLVQSVSHTQAKLGADVELPPERTPQARKKIEEMSPDGRSYWKRKSEEQRHILENRSRAFVTPPFADRIRALPPPAAVQGGRDQPPQVIEVRHRQGGEMMETVANRRDDRIAPPRGLEPQGNLVERAQQRAFVTPPFADQIRALPPPAAVQGGRDQPPQVMEVRHRQGGEMMEMVANRRDDRVVPPRGPEPQGNLVEQARQRQATDTRLRQLAEETDRNAERIQQIQDPAQRENFLDIVERGRRFRAMIMEEMNAVPAERRMVEEMDIFIAQHNQQMLAQQLDRLLQPRDVGAGAIPDPAQPAQPPQDLAALFRLNTGSQAQRVQQPTGNQQNVTGPPLVRRMAIPGPFASINEQLRSLRFLEDVRAAVRFVGGGGAA